MQLTINQQYHNQQEGQHIQNQVQIVSHDKVYVFLLTNELLNSNLTQIKSNTIRTSCGYSSRVYLYKQPICTFNKVQFCLESSKLSHIIESLGPVCFTYNNTQYSQEPNYNHQPIYSRPPSAESIQTVVQICQNNLFVHENYRIQALTRIGFFIDTCTRYGTNIYLQYYNARINLRQFGADSLVQNTIAKFTDHMNRLTIAVDSVNPHHRVRMDNLQMQTQTNQMKIYQHIKDNLQQVKINFQFDFKFYFLLKVVNGKKEKYYAISRKCKVSSLKYLLIIVCKKEVSLYYNNSIKQINDDFVQKQQIIECHFKDQQKRLVSLPLPVTSCQLIGQTGTVSSKNLTLYFIQNSSILYRIYLNLITNEACHMSLTVMACPPTQQLDQDLFFIRNNKIVSYSITVNMIKVKYYSLDGTLQILKVFPWYHDLYDIQFSVVDLFCVRLKNRSKNYIRVFYINDPEQYLEVGPCHKFYPARNGNNVYSDESGIFAISNHWAQSLQIYSLKHKTKQSQIRLNNFKQLTDVFFTNFDKNISKQNKQNQIYIFLNFNNKQLNIHKVSSGQKILSILCERGMKQFIARKQNIWCCVGSQVRMFQWKKNQSNCKDSCNNNKEQRQNNKKERYLKWSQPIYIPEKAIIIQEKGIAFIRQNILQLTAQQFYFMQKLIK